MDSTVKVCLAEAPRPQIWTLKQVRKLFLSPKGMKAKSTKQWQYLCRHWAISFLYVLLNHNRFKKDKICWLWLSTLQLFVPECIKNAFSTNLSVCCLIGQMREFITVTRNSLISHSSCFIFDTLQHTVTLIPIRALRLLPPETVFKFLGFQSDLTDSKYVSINSIS